jgi:hypothetical protein
MKAHAEALRDGAAAVPAPIGSPLSAENTKMRQDRGPL